MVLEIITSLAIVVSISFTVYRYVTAPKGLLNARRDSMPREAREGQAVGNYPPPGVRNPSGAPNSYSFSDDRWLDWVAIIALFCGLMYAFYLGSTPAGKMSQ